jgi:hypothetical protein
LYLRRRAISACYARSDRSGDGLVSRHPCLLDACKGALAALESGAVSLAGTRRSQQTYAFGEPDNCVGRAMAFVEMLASRRVTHANKSDVLCQSVRSTSQDLPACRLCNISNGGLGAPLVQSMDWEILFQKRDEQFSCFLRRRTHSW